MPVGPLRSLETIEIGITDPHHPAPEALAQQLEATGNYKILRRLIPRECTPEPAGASERFGIILDLETTGLDPLNDEVIELGAVKFPLLRRRRHHRRLRYLPGVQPALRLNPGAGQRVDRHYRRDGGRAQDRQSRS